ncbi:MULTISPECIES: DUF6769 family protein [Proteiniphilum]|uniref:DUF6769 family protein n=1 Tax=Proteiniphilum TaxID=294702 RepID=UPI001EEC88A8|nr:MULTISPECIES: DUF6769 family protein [Proteiniphilum]ULB33196.1 hypothetical protein KDN43_09055 [Proteiniphilum propionicum]
MKKRFSISFILLAALLLLMSGIIPHHHHDGLPCVMMECCETDNIPGDIHRHAAGSGKNGQSCVADADYFVPGSENKIKYKVSICGGCDNLNHIHLFPLFFLVADYVAVPGENTLNKTGYWEYTAFYISPGNTQIHGLRAPPFLY